MTPTTPVEALAARLLDGLAAMATQASVPMDLWDRFSNDVLAAAAAIPPTPTGGGEADLRAVLQDVLDRDGEWARSGVKADCDCINLSRAGEREYETGTCPHQRARRLLAAHEAGEA